MPSSGQIYKRPLGSWPSFCLNNSSRLREIILQFLYRRQYTKRTHEPAAFHDTWSIKKVIREESRSKVIWIALQSRYMCRQFRNLSARYRFVKYHQRRRPIVCDLNQEPEGYHQLRFTQDPAEEHPPPPPGPQPSLSPSLPAPPRSFWWRELSDRGLSWPGLPGACNWKRPNSVLKKAKFWILLNKLWEKKAKH